MTNVEELREKAYVECLNMLLLKNRCALVRPTGFGKTGILTKLIEYFGNATYVYPAEVIRDAVLVFYYGSPDKVPENRSIPGVNFISYQALAILDEKNEKHQKIFNDIVQSKLIIFDECHRIGAEGASKTLDKILEQRPNIKMIGATATPERMDMIDEIARYFDNNFISEYNLHDAFRDGVLQRPHYFYCNYKKMSRDLDREIKQAEKEIALISSDDKLREYSHLRQSLVEISDIYRMPRIIRKICHKYASNEDYMRFICFNSTYELLAKSAKKVRSWFEEAYPDYTINVTEVSAREEDTRQNAVSLKYMKNKSKTIDLIMSCDMLNMGYHVNDLTGILMFRGTKSGIIYSQQLGRILSSGDTESKICIDVVDNIHVQSSYTLFGKKSEHDQFLNRRRVQLLHKKELNAAAKEINLGNIDLSVLIEKFPGVTETELSTLIESGVTHSSCEWSEADQRELDNLSAGIKKYARYFRSNTLQKEDLIAVDYEATYRELISKTVAEAKSMRARQAWARWLEQGGTPLDENGVPLTRMQILQLVPPENIPLPPFCYAKQVSIDAVLDEMGVI